MIHVERPDGKIEDWPTADSCFLNANKSLSLVMIVEEETQSTETIGKFFKKHVVVKRKHVRSKTLGEYAPEAWSSWWGDE